MKTLVYTSIHLADQNRMSGLILFYQECRLQGLKPLLGVELTDSKKPSERVILVACSAEGYGDLCEIITQRQRYSDQFTFEKTFSEAWPQLFFLTASIKPLRLLSTSPNHPNTFIEVDRLILSGAFDEFEITQPESLYILEEIHGQYKSEAREAVAAVDNPRYVGRRVKVLGMPVTDRQHYVAEFGSFEVWAKLIEDWGNYSIVAESVKAVEWNTALMDFARASERLKAGLKKNQTYADLKQTLAA